MPMLYVIQNGGNFVPSATPAEKIVYLVCSLNKIISADKQSILLMVMQPID
jgi:hypothetical protein